MNTPYLEGSFGTRTLVCPLKGHICSGAHFGCIYDCEKEVRKRTKFKREGNQAYRQDFNTKMDQFSEQSRTFEGGICPRCAASVEVSMARAHMTYHYNNDAELQYDPPFRR